MSDCYSIPFCSSLRLPAVYRPQGQRNHVPLFRPSGAGHPRLRTLLRTIYHVCGLLAHCTRAPTCSKTASSPSRSSKAPTVTQNFTLDGFSFVTDDCLHNRKHRADLRDHSGSRGLVKLPSFPARAEKISCLNIEPVSPYKKRTSQEVRFVFVHKYARMQSV